MIEHHRLFLKCENNECKSNIRLTAFKYFTEINIVSFLIFLRFIRYFFRFDHFLFFYVNRISFLCNDNNYSG